MTRSPSTPPPLQTPAPPDWLAVDELPSQPLAPLLFGLAQTELHGRAQTLRRALALPDPDGLAGRLLGQPPSGPACHAAHLHALSAPLTGEYRRALYSALGVASPEPAELPAPERRLRLNALPLPAQPPEERSPADPATYLTRTLARLEADPGGVLALNAALGREALHQVTRHWLEDRHVLHLELLCGLRDPQGSAPYQNALHHLQTTLGGGRRSAARTLLGEVRHLHAQMLDDQARRAALRRDALRATVLAASVLRDAGHLYRLADARWLTPTELRDALDGTLPPHTLQLTAEVRREQHADLAILSAPPAPEAAPPTFVAGRALAPGVRDGPVHIFRTGVPVPPGSVVVAPHLWPAQFPHLAGAAALLLPHATEAGHAAQDARERALAALSLGGPPPAWLAQAALVRVNGHDGRLTLLRPADPGPSPEWPRLDLDLEAETADALREIEMDFS